MLYPLGMASSSVSRALVSAKTPSNHLLRWLISMAEMPSPGRATKLALGLFENGERQDGGAGGEVVNAIGHM